MSWPMWVFKLFSKYFLKFGVIGGASNENIDEACPWQEEQQIIQLEKEQT